jgi:hypothetical protein
MMTDTAGVVDDVGRVETAAKADLDDRGIGWMLGKQDEGDGRQDLENGDLLAGIGFGDTAQGVGEHGIIDQLRRARPSTPMR